MLIAASCDPDDNRIERTGERLVPELVCNHAAVSHVNLPDGGCPYMVGPTCWNPGTCSYVPCPKNS